jgi:DNA helicase-2/ATP-dependent DNA helicase PcrA
LKILRKNVDTIGYSSNFTVIDDEDQSLLIRDIYKQGNISQKDIKPAKMIGIIEKIKMNDVGVETISTMQQLKELGIFSFEDLKIVKYVHQRYQAKLKSGNILDFNDLLLFTHKILKENIDIRDYWQKHFHYILVDEFQDTNIIQFEILNYLINPKQINVFAVGDPDQTIYTWRGAYANIFNDYLESYKNTQVMILDLNYRSTKNILKVANSLVSNNHERIKKDLSTDNPQGVEVVFCKSDSQYYEASFICQQIIELVKKEKYQYSDIAILYRSNYLSRFIEQELMSNSIPYYIYGSLKFYQRMEIKDLLAYLRLMADDQNEIALKRVINVPRRNIGEVTIDRVSEYARKNNMTFAQALALSLRMDVEIT